MSILFFSLRTRQLLMIRSQCAAVALPKDFGWLKEDSIKIE